MPFESSLEIGAHFFRAVSFREPVEPTRRRLADRGAKSGRGLAKFCARRVGGDSPVTSAAATAQVGWGVGRLRGNVLPQVVVPP